MEMKMKVEGLRDLERKLIDLQQEYGGRTAAQALRPAVKAAMTPLVSEVEGNTPVDTGVLQSSTRLKIGKPTKKMVSRSGHYKSTTIIYGQVGWFWRGGRFWPQVIAVEFGTMETPAHNVLRSALENNARGIVTRFKNTLGPSIEKKAAAAARKRRKAWQR